MNSLQYIFIAIAVVSIAIILTQNGRRFVIAASLIVGALAWIIHEAVEKVRS